VSETRTSTTLVRGGSFDAEGRRRYDVWIDKDQLPRVSALNAAYASDYADWMIVFGHRVYTDFTITEATR
jgi:hypothetical protein